MYFNEIAKLAVDETAAEEYLYLKNILKKFDSCPKCNSTHINLVRRKNYKCYDCDTEWSYRKNSILENSNLSCSELIALINSFSEKQPVLYAAKYLGMGEKTIRNFYDKFRVALSNLSPEILHTLDVNLEKKSPYFRIECNDQKIITSIYIGMGEPGTYFAMTDTTKLKKENLTYFPNAYNEGIVKFHNINSEEMKFWKYLTIRMSKFVGINLKNLFLLIKELEFRYNFNDNNLFDVIAGQIGQDNKITNIFSVVKIGNNFAEDIYTDFLLLLNDRFSSSND